MIQIINDGDEIDLKIVEEYRLYNLCSRGKYDFVGFINLHDKILISCPKHFCYNNSSDIKLIVKCIIKSFIESDIGSNELIDCNIPVRPYLFLLDYYYKYGIYKKRKSSCAEGYGGDVNWNRTFRRSQCIHSGNNFVFLPFEVKKTIFEDSFLSECMTYAINDGYEQFGKYVGIGTFLDTDGYNYSFSDENKIIKLLKEEEGNCFKDIDIQLIRALITYFSWEGGKNDNTYFITQSFDQTWEKMVRDYLNANFAGYDYGLQCMMFQNYCKKFSFIKKRVSVEKKGTDSRGFEVEYDHITKDALNGKVFLFDSKYYEKIKELNYKQMAYHYLVANDTSGNSINPQNIINGLILPTESSYKTVVHVDRNNIDGVAIREHYLNIREVMSKYVG